MSALNIFKTVTAQVTTTSSAIYTAPTNYTGIILMAQISNITASVGQVTVKHSNGATDISLLTDFAVPGNDAVSATVGKLVLEQGSSLKVLANDNGVFEITLSILETANG